MTTPTPLRDTTDFPLKLRNEGALSLTFIGSGSAFSKKFFQNNLLVVKGGSHVLVDCGTRAPEALAVMGSSVLKIENYLITHSHADHVGGLEEVMLLNRYVAKRKPNIVVTAAYGRRLWKDSLRGGAAFNERHSGRYLRFRDMWNVIEPRRVPGGDRQLCEAAVGEIRFKLFRTKHIPDFARSWKESALSYGLVIDDRVLFTSDTRYDEEMVLSLDGKYRFEAIFHDCQLYTGGVHASIDELARLPEDVRSRMYLMHYQDGADEQLEKAAKLGFRGFAKQWFRYDFPS